MDKKKSEKFANDILQYFDDLPQIESSLVFEKQTCNNLKVKRFDVTTNLLLLSIILVFFNISVIHYGIKTNVNKTEYRNVCELTEIYKLYE